MQAGSYYPFGAIASSYQRIGEYENLYKFNGKELQTDLDLNWYDFGARMYMPELGRWGVVDALADSNWMYSTPSGASLCAGLSEGRTCALMQ